METVFKCYQEFANAYPKSDWADDARSNMVRIGHELAKAGKAEYEAVIKSFEESGDEEVKLAALYALQNIGDDDALKTVIGLYDKYEGREAQEPDRLHAPGLRVPGGLRQAPRDRPQRPRPQGPEERSLRHRGEGRNRVPPGPEGRPQVQGRTRRSGRAALFALGDVDDPSIVPFLVDIALTEADAEMARTAAFALENIDAKEARAAVLRILKEAKDPEVRKAALFSSVRKGGRRRLPS